jgi:hypothetical protein
MRDKNQVKLEQFLCLRQKRWISAKPRAFALDFEIVKVACSEPIHQHRGGDNNHVKMVSNQSADWRSSCAFFAQIHCRYHGFRRAGLLTSHSREESFAIRGRVAALSSLPILGTQSIMDTIRKSSELTGDQAQQSTGQVPNSRLRTCNGSSGMRRQRLTDV